MWKNLIHINPTWSYRHCQIYPECHSKEYGFHITKVRLFKCEQQLSVGWHYMFCWSFVLCDDLDRDTKDQSDETWQSRLEPSKLSSW